MSHCSWVALCGCKCVNAFLDALSRDTRSGQRPTPSWYGMDGAADGGGQGGGCEGAVRGARQRGAGDVVVVRDVVGFSLGGVLACGAVPV
jgi:hypothetical protein